MDDRAKELQGTGGETDAIRRPPAAPGGSRQHERTAEQDGAAPPGGATENSRGALGSNEEDVATDSGHDTT